MSVEIHCQTDSKKSLPGAANNRPKPVCPEKSDWPVSHGQSKATLHWSAGRGQADTKESCLLSKNGEGLKKGDNKISSPRLLKLFFQYMLREIGVLSEKFQ